MTTTTDSATADLSDLLRGFHQVPLHSLSHIKVTGYHTRGLAQPTRTVIYNDLNDTFLTNVLNTDAGLKRKINLQHVSHLDLSWFFPLGQVKYSFEKSYLGSNQTTFKSATCTLKLTECHFWRATSSGRQQWSSLKQLPLHNETELDASEQTGKRPRLDSLEQNNLRKDTVIVQTTGVCRMMQYN